MIIIQHRVNSSSSLATLTPGIGLEVDLRSYETDIVLNHEPFCKGEHFTTLASQIAQSDPTQMIILNVKEDGLEEALLKICKENGLKNYFFLDSQVPTIYRLNHEQRLTCFAVRYSHLEPREYVLNFQDICQWVWVDCFPEFSPKIEDIRQFQDAGFRICIASPELQSQNNRTIEEYKHIRDLLRPATDAICSKKTAQWSSI